MVNSCKQVEQQGYSKDAKHPTIHHYASTCHTFFIATQFGASREQKSLKPSHLNLLIRMMLDLVPRVVVFGIPGFPGKDSRRTSSFTGFHAGAAAPCRLEKWKEHHEAETFSRHFTTLLMLDV